MLCFVPVLHGCVCCYVEKNALPQCLCNCERRDIGMYEVPLSVSLLGFWDMDYVSQLPSVRYYVLNIFVRNTSPKGLMCFRCLIFSLSGPCELLFLHCFIAALTREVVSLMLYPCMFCVALSMDLFILCVACLTVFVNCLVKHSQYVWVCLLFCC